MPCPEPSEGLVNLDSDWTNIDPVTFVSNDGLTITVQTPRDLTGEIPAFARFRGEQNGLLRYLLITGVTETTLTFDLTHEFATGQTLDDAPIIRAAYATAYVPFAYPITFPVSTPAIPPGSMNMYAAATAPDGWLLCDGQSYSRIAYPSLFAVIGVTYGNVDGSSFNVPDMRGRVGAGLAPTGHTDVATLGNTDGTALANRRPRHRSSVWDPWHDHAVSDLGHSHGYNSVHVNQAAGGSAVDANLGAAGTTDTGYAQIVLNAAGTDIQVSPDAPGDTHSPQDAPAYLVVNYIIKI